MKEERAGDTDKPLPLPIGRTWSQETEGYDRIRKELIWNARLASAGSPQLIVRPASSTEVQRWVKWASAEGLRVSLRGSGHNYQAASIRGDGLLIDLSGLSQINIDKERRRASVGSGVTGGRLIKALAQEDFAFPIGHCADVALSGFILSGGIGWNYGNWGPACSSVSAIEMVTADGELLTVDAATEPDLFWAAKGAGSSFFAAVTGYELLLHDVPRSAVALEMVFHASSIPVVARWLEDSMPESDPTVEIICMVGPEPDSGIPSVTVRMVSNGRDASQALTKFGALQRPPVQADYLSTAAAQIMSFLDLPQLSAMPSGKRVAADQLWSEAGPAEILPAVQHLAHIPSRSSTISITCLGGGGTIPGVHGASDSAFSRVGATSIGIYALWDESNDDDRHIDWVAAVDAALAPFRTGRYIGEADLFVSPNRLAECFEHTALHRLKELKERYDPAGLFCGN